MTRPVITTELGEEIQCVKCLEFWPNDPEFFYFSKGVPHSWCKACYVNDPKQIEKNKRWVAKKSVKRAVKRAVKVAVKKAAAGARHEQRGVSA
ncbi:MAG: hypothetical protein Q7K57_61225 [Burkholderiaceae bacterium]|nr:hypothetical protein [Burkholderiaceae bacterium]